MAMAKILCISSFVARGHIGLAAIGPALQGLGHETISLPSVLLSNHPGHATFAKHDVPAAMLDGALEAYDRSGWLRDIDALLTGYLPSVAHVSAAAEIADRVCKANPACLYVCDPVLGDDPGGLYIEPNAACAMRDMLLARAAIVTPNRFELSWLSGRPVTNQTDAVAAARSLQSAEVLVTSVPGADGTLGNLIVSGTAHHSAEVPKLKSVPHGTGDFFAALFLGHILNGQASAKALELASAGVHAVAVASQGLDELSIIPHWALWAKSKKFQV
jgi:pyridoxine kinase